MHRAAQFLLQRRINRALLRHPAQTGQFVGRHHDAKMRLAPFTPASMTPMLLTLVNDIKMARREGAGQLRMDLIRNSQFSAYGCNKRVGVVSGNTKLSVPESQSQKDKG